MKTWTIRDWGLLILRLSFGISMLAGHGFGKFIRLVSGQAIRFPDPIGLGSEVGFVLVVLAEVFCALDVSLGLFARINAVPLMFTMAVAAFIQHGGQTFRQRETALLYLFGFTAIFLLGAGRISVKSLLKQPTRQGAGFWEFLLEREVVFW